jgi:RNA polymerase sigma-70 factor (ECF subfamily)
MAKLPQTGIVIPIHRSAEAQLADEAAVVGRAQRGDRAAQTELFRRHAGRITAMLVRLLGSHADAEDAAQEAFVQAFRDLPQLRDPAALGQWLTQLAVRRAHQRFRRRRVLSALGIDSPPRDGALDRIADPRASADVRAELALLDHALAGLGAGQRLAWMLRHVEGYELSQVGRLCGCSLATVKRRIAAANARVAEHVAIEGVDD